MIYCQCEAVDHEIDGPLDHEHWESVPATSQAKLIYGTFFLCEYCDTNHYDDGDRTAPSTPLEVKVTKAERAKLIEEVMGERDKLLAADHERIKGMPISVMLTPVQIAALAAAADFILLNGGFPNEPHLTEHLRNALKVLDS